LVQSALNDLNKNQKHIYSFEGDKHTVTFCFYTIIYECKYVLPCTLLCAFHITHALPSSVGHSPFSPTACVVPNSGNNLSITVTARLCIRGFTTMHYIIGLFTY